MTPTCPSTDHLPAFTELLEQRGVPARARPYFIHWAKLWFSGTSPSSADETGTFFENLGRSPKVQPWQFRQAVRSVAWLARDILHLPWAANFDWRGLAESALLMSRRVATNLNLKRRGAPVSGLPGLDVV